MPYGGCWAGQLEVHTYTDLISYSHEMFCIPSGKFTQIPTSYQFFCSINVLHFVQTSMGRSRHHCIITRTLPCHYASLAHRSHDSTVQFVGHITALPKSLECHACPTEKKRLIFQLKYSRLDQNFHHNTNRWKIWDVTHHPNWTTGHMPQGVTVRDWFPSWVNVEVSHLDRIAVTSTSELCLVTVRGSTALMILHCFFLSKKGHIKLTAQTSRSSWVVWRF